MGLTHPTLILFVKSRSFGNQNFKSLELSVTPYSLLLTSYFLLFTSSHPIPACLNKPINLRLRTCC